MTEDSSNNAETFDVDDWVALYQGKKFNRKVEVTAVKGNEVTVRIAGRFTVFTPRASDGKMVEAASHNSQSPLMITHLPQPRTTSRWKDARDFIFGLLLGS